MAFRGEFELRHRTSADSLNFGGVRVPDDLLSRRRLQEDLREDDGEDDDAPPEYELDENGSIASLESVQPEKNNVLRFALLAVLSCICGISLTLFLFLVPFQIDPSMSAILSDFRPAKCSVANHSMDAGAENCSWSSCREGCTRELFKCYQVRVRYAPNDSGSVDYGGFSDAQERLGVLFVNVVGCGYPPAVSCERFYEEYGKRLKQDFPCFYSLKNDSLVITEYDEGEEMMKVSLACVPLLITVLSGIGLLITPGVMRAKALRTGSGNKADGLQEDLERIEEEKIVSQEPPSVPPDPQAFTVQDVGNGGGDGLFGSDVFQEHSSNGHVGENNLGYVDVENGVAGNGFARSKRKVDAVELPTLQKRVRHAE